MGLELLTTESGYVLPVGALSVTVNCEWSDGPGGKPIAVGYGVRDSGVAANAGVKCPTNPAPIDKHCSAAARGTLTYSDTGPGAPNQVVILSLATPDVTLDVSSSAPNGSEPIDHDTLLSYLGLATTAADLPNPGAWADPFGDDGAATNPPTADPTASNPSGELPTAECPTEETLQVALRGTDFAAYDMTDIRCDSEGWAAANVNNTHEQVAVAFRRDGATWAYVADKDAVCRAGEVPSDLRDIVCAVGG